MTAVLRRYFRGRKLNTMEDVVAGKKYVYHFDHQGSTQALTDATTGAVTDRFASDAWGVPVKRTGTSLNRNWYIGNSGYSQAPRSALLLSPGAAFQPDLGAFLQALERAGYLLRDPVLTPGAVGQVYGPTPRKVNPPIGSPKPGPGGGIRPIGPPSTRPPGPPSIRPPGPPPGPGPWQGICARGYAWLRAGQSIVLKVAGCCKPMVFGVGGCVLQDLICPTQLADGTRSCDDADLAHLSKSCTLRTPHYDNIDDAIKNFEKKHAYDCSNWRHRRSKRSITGKPICKGRSGYVHGEYHIDMCCKDPVDGGRTGGDCGRGETDMGTVVCCPYCDPAKPRVGTVCCGTYRSFYDDWDEENGWDEES